MKQRWTELKPVLREVPDYIRNEADRLAVSNALNTAMWPIDQGWTEDANMTYEEAIAYILSAYEANFRFVDEIVGNLL